MSISATAVRIGRSLHHDTGIPAIADPAAAEDFLAKYDTFILDCDGVIWQGGALLPLSAETLALFRARGKRLVFVTNNSSRSRAQYRQKFTRLGIEASEDEIVSSSFAAAEYLRTERPQVRKVYLVGSAGVAEELELAGIAVDTAENDSKTAVSEEEFSALRVDPAIGAVVCGWDLSFTSYKMSYASLCLQQNPECVFVATNRDAFDRLRDRNVPGNGAQVAAIEVASGVAPIEVGKPTKWLMDLVINRYGLDPRRTCMIGDRLDTDILFGNAGRVDTALTLTGCTLPDQVRELAPDDAARPVQILPYLGVLAASVPSARL